ncbi:MAG: serine/threonine protein kinase [Myxococcales bacterium]|nr:MAG: serine/threonine protein kinase [Myxococcales bacterium]
MSPPAGPRIEYQAGETSRAFIRRGHFPARRPADILTRLSELGARHIESMNSSTANDLGAGDQGVGPIRPGDLVAEKYVVVRTLGVGGMGVVVQARDQVLDRQVAIKFLLPKLVGSDTAVQRFVREARAATRITSEHVVRLLEIEKLPSGTPFFVMEYLDGCDLRTLLREQGALPASLAVDYVLQALQAVAEGHVRGIVHRDIKPGNLFLTRRADGTPLIKVLDFGIAKTAESDAAESTSLTSSDDVRLGSPAYMPPEQLQNPRDVDLRSDIWSLGATLYELLSGRPPFQGPGYLELATHVLTRPPTPLSEHKIEAPPKGLEQVVLKCLEKERSLRYANAQELATALARYGSADARMSLTRVSGMFASSSSFPALTRAISADPAVCDPTLDVSSGAAGRKHDVTQTGDHRDTSDINGKATKSAMGWLAIGAVAMLGILGFVLSRPTVPVAVVPVAAVPVPAQPPAVVSMLVIPPRPASEPTSSPPAPSVVEPAPKKRPARVVAAVIAEPSAPLSTAALPPVDEAEKAPAAGRSEEIERLIQHRR